MRVIQITDIALMVLEERGIDLLTSIQWFNLTNYIYYLARFDDLRLDEIIDLLRKYDLDEKWED